MQITLQVNDQPVEMDLSDLQSWSQLVSTLQEKLAESGWKISQIQLDGRLVAPGETPAEFSAGSLRAGNHCVAVSTTPSLKAIEALRENLLATLPRFREQGERLSKAFARGEWRSTLEQLTTFLEEFKVLLKGFRTVAGSDGKPPVARIEKVPEVLSELSSHIRKQSWVEVSDVLLYELVPLIEEWESHTPLEQE